MPSSFGIDELVEAVLEEKGARGRAGDGGPLPAEPDEDPARRIRDRLWEHKNCKSGIPLARGRHGGAGVVPAVKKMFRRLFQPFINEMFERQLHFNDAVFDLATELFARIDELEESVRALEERAAALRERAEAAEREAAALRADAESRRAGPPS